MIAVAPQETPMRPEVAGALSLARRHEESAWRVRYCRFWGESRARRHLEKAHKLRQRAAALEAKGGPR